MFRFLLITSLVLVSTSCLKQSESINPIAKPQTLAELQRESLMAVAKEAGNSDLSSDAQATLQTTSADPSIFYLNVKYNMTNIDVFEVAGMPNTFEQIGHSFLQAAAKFVLAIIGPVNININTINIHIPDINLDRGIVQSIKVKRIFIQYNSAVDIASDYAANFSFINTLELSREVVVPKIGKVDTLMFSYQKSRNFCLYKCIQFDVMVDNMIDLLKPNTDIQVKPTLSVGSLPDVSDIKLDGEIELQIGLKLPF